MQNRYAISRSCEGWMISVNGAGVLVCKNKNAALRAVRDAEIGDRSSREGGASLADVELRLRRRIDAPDQPDAGDAQRH